MLRHVLNVLMRTGSCNPTQEDSAGSQGNKYPVQDPPSGVCTHTGLSSFIVNYHISGFHLPGDVLETAIIYPVGAGSSLAGAQAKIKELLLKHRWVKANYCSAIIFHNKVRTDRYIVPFSVSVGRFYSGVHYPIPSFPILYLFFSYLIFYYIPCHPNLPSLV